MLFLERLLMDLMLLIRLKVLVVKVVERLRLLGSKTVESFKNNNNNVLLHNFPSSNLRIRDNNIKNNSNDPS